MAKKISSFVTLAISILVGNFIIDLFLLKADPYLKGKTIYITIVLKMLVSVLVFYPVFSLLDVYVKNLSEAFIKSTKTLTGQSIAGALISLLAAFLLVFSGYAYFVYKAPFF